MANGKNGREPGKTERWVAVVICLLMKQRFPQLNPNPGSIEYRSTRVLTDIIVNLVALTTTGATKYVRFNKCEFN